MPVSISSKTAHPSILLVDDEEDILDLLQYNLERDGFLTQTAQDGLEALNFVARKEPDLIVLDVMMPRMNGFEACQQLRQDERFSKIPIIMLTARNGEQDYVRGLDAGADVYLTKPISPRVLSSQIRALLRSRTRLSSLPECVIVENLEIDRTRYLAYRYANGIKEVLHFPRQQFELLHFLAAQAGKVFTRDELLDALWDRDADVIERTVDVHIRKIREQIGNEFIETVKGVGYRFREA